MRSASKKCPCPCGSGKKHRQCCASKSFRFSYKDGLLHKVTPAGRDVMQALAHRRHAEKYRRAVIAGLRVAGVDEGLVYAFEQSGYFVTDDNRRLIPETARAEWDRAVARWRSGHNA
jgi:hypothetical protein